MREYTKNLGKVVMTPKGVWSIEKEYEILDIVHDSVTDHAYVSKQEVPLGVDLSDSRYWMPLNVSGYSDSNVIALNSFNKDGEIQSYTLEKAIKTIKDVGRKSGAILIFYNDNTNRLDITTGCWEIWQFNSINVYDWENLDAWVNVYYNYNKFVGWYAADNILNKEIPNPDVGCYAFVGNIYNEAFVYRCDIKNQWTKTNQKAQHYIKVVFGDNISIGANGNWLQNGVDTNIPVSVKGDNGLTPYLRWSDNNQIEYSYDNINWYILSNRFNTNIKIKDYVSSVSELPNDVELGTVYGVGPTYTDDDIEQINSIYNLYVYTSNGWINNGRFNSFSAGVVQETGNNKTVVMSQEAVTRELTVLESETSLLDVTKVVPSENKGYFISQSSLQPVQTSALICYTSPIFVPKYAKIVANIKGSNLMSVMALSDEKGNIIRSLYAGNDTQTKYDFTAIEDTYIVLSYVYSEPYSVVIGKSEIDVKNKIEKLQSVLTQSKLIAVSNNVEVNQYLKEIVLINFDYTAPCTITFQKAFEYNGTYYNGANIVQNGKTISVVNLYNNVKDAINNGNIFFVERKGNVAIFDLSALSEGDVIEYKNVSIIGDILYNNIINMRYKSPARSYNILNMGDSLFGAYRDHTSISNLLAQMTSAKVLNGAMGGTTMAVWYEDYSETNKQGWSDFSFYRLAAAIASKDFSKQRSSLELYKIYLPSYFNDVIDILESIDYNEINIITLSFGTNDYTCNVPIKSIEDWQEQYRFIPALKKGMELIYNAYPHIRFVLCTPMYRGDRTNENEVGLYLTDYVNAIKDTAKEYNTMVCDFNGEMGVNSYNIKSIFGNQTDLVHPTSEGRKMMANKLAFCINQM